MTTTSETAAVNAVIDAWAQAMRDKDAAAAFALHADGFVHFSLAPPLLSAAAQAANLDAWLRTWDGPLGYELHDRAVTVGGDVAYCTSLNRMHGRKTDGERVDLWFRQTLGLRRQDGAWRIAHQHESVPFYMDGSFRAATDLTP